MTLISSSSLKSKDKLNNQETGNTIFVNIWLLKEYSSCHYAHWVFFYSLVQSHKDFCTVIQNLLRIVIPSHDQRLDCFLNQTRHYNKAKIFPPLLHINQK